MSVYAAVWTSLRIAAFRVDYSRRVRKVEGGGERERVTQDAKRQWNSGPVSSSFSREISKNSWHIITTNITKSTNKPTSQQVCMPILQR
jgi:hypothetical protein